MNVNDRMVERIDNIRDSVPDYEDGVKLDYIRSQITPEGLARRDEEDQDVKHLREEADHIIKRHTKEQTKPDA